MAMTAEQQLIVDVTKVLQKWRQQAEFDEENRNSQSAAAFDQCADDLQAAYLRLRASRIGWAGGRAGELRIPQ